MGATLRGRRGRPPAARDPRRRAARASPIEPEVPSAQVKIAPCCSPACTPPARPASSSRPLPATIRSARSRRSACRVTTRRPRRFGARRPAAARPRRCACPATCRRRRSSPWPRRRLPGSDVTIEDVGPQPVARRAPRRAPTRRRALSTTVDHRDWHGEPVGRLRVRHGELRRLVITPAEVPEVIDELPVLAALAHVRRQRHGVAAPASSASRRAIASPRWSPAFAPWAPTPTSIPTGSPPRHAPLTGGVVDARHDHRLAMAFAIAALGATGPTAHPRRRSRRPCRTPASSTTSTAARVKADKIYLVGFMGAGKTHGRPAPWPSGSTGAPRTSTSGSSAPSGATSRPFSPGRRAVLPRASSAPCPDRPAADRGVVVATGGGTFDDPQNRELMLRDGAVVWLDVPFATIARPGPAGRPPAARRRSRWRWNGSIISASQPIVWRTLRVDAGRGSVEELVDQIVDVVGDLMRYLVISDIHANLEAFDTVMAAAAPLGYDRTLVLGDLVGYGADPNAVCDRVRALAPLRHHPRQSRQGGRRASSPPKASTPWPATPSAGPTTRFADDNRTGWRRCRPARSPSTTCSRFATARRSTRTPTCSTISTRCAPCTRRAGRSACSATRTCRSAIIL